MIFEDWYKCRHYRHFDNPVSYDKAKSLVTSEEAVQRHSFYPFIYFEIPKLKLRLVDGKIIRDKKGDAHIKKRTISYAAHSDSHIFGYYSYLLGMKYESFISKSKRLHHSILAFRKLQKSNIDFAKDAFDKIKELGNCTALALDITGFFDNIDHFILKQQWCRILEVSKLPNDHYAVYKAITKFSMINRDCLATHFPNNRHAISKQKQHRICTPKEFRNFRKNFPERLIRNSQSKGIPQGSPISALLSNIYMLDFDQAVLNYLYQQNPNFSYFRYCDDILCIVDKANIENVLSFIEEEISKLKLSINEKKKDIVDFTISSNGLKSSSALQYLGFILANDSISLRSAGFNRYSLKMKRAVSLAKQTQRKYNTIRKNKGLPPKKLYKKQLYSRYSHFGKRNFISYGKRAAEKFNSQTIKKQLKPLHHRLLRKIYCTT